MRSALHPLVSPGTPESSMLILNDFFDLLRTLYRLSKSYRILIFRFIGTVSNSTVIKLDRESGTHDYNRIKGRVLV